MPDGSRECLQDYGAVKQRLETVERRLETISKELSGINEKLHELNLTHATDEAKHAADRGVALWVGRFILTILAGAVAWVATHFFEWVISPGGPFNRN